MFSNGILIAAFLPLYNTTQDRTQS